MRQSRVIQKFVQLSCGAATTLLGLSASSAAVELRTSAGDRPVVRTVAYDEFAMQTPLADPELGVMAADPWVDGQYANYGQDSCGPGLAACGPLQYWARVEYLLWWRQERDLPPLVTSSPFGTAEASAGVLGLNTTSVLFGNESVGDDAGSGGRIEFGLWLDACQCWALSADFWALDEDTVTFDLSSNSNPIIARPFADLGTQDAFLVAFPNVRTGNINVSSEADVLGADVLFRRRLSRGACGELDLLLGYQTTRIDEHLIISSSSTVTEVGGSTPVGTTIDLRDSFETQNEFHGAVIGLASRWEQNCWRFESLAKVGLGNMNRQAEISGSTRTVVPGGGTTVGGGLLALNNPGLFEDDQFAAVPELSFTMTRALNRCSDLVIGYNFIFWSDVAQAGEQVDLNVDVAAGTNVPAEFTFQDSDYFVHGLRLGVQGSY